MFDTNKNLKAMQISLASPEVIRSWGKGEVQNHETLDYRTGKPKFGGLFCEEIFGPYKDYQCSCGNLKGVKHKGEVCAKCKVEVISSECRRERMGYINLAAPCTHIWYLKSSPSYIHTLLSIYETNISPKEIEDLINFSGSICIKVNDANNKDIPIKKGQYLDDKDSLLVFKNVIEYRINSGVIEAGSIDEYKANRIKAGLENNDLSFIPEAIEYLNKFCGIEIGRGAEAIKKLLIDIGDHIEEHYENVKKEIKSQTSDVRIAALTKRLEVISCFTKKDEQGNYINKPSWMVLDTIPVIPPDLRPIISIDGGKTASSDLNDLYLEIINSNLRLKDEINNNAPSVTITSEKRKLQKAVDELLDNEKLKSKVKTKKEKKSLTSALKGKQGRFRQNLLGKRVDYSGRSVIAVGPDLKMYQCGIPHEMAIELLRPFIAHELISNGKADSNPEANELIDRGDVEVYNIIERIISNHPVLLNRAPTLHRLGIQAFQPKLVDGHAIRLHPLVCAGFNADFDGDQMAVHVPLSKEAQEEAVNLMLATNNILKPSDGEPIVSPSQDMVLGNYYLSIEESKEDFLKRAEEFKNKGDELFADRYTLFAENEGKLFGSVDDVVKAYETHQVSLHNRIAIPAKAIGKDLTVFSEELQNMYLLTSVGKIIFNSIFPSNFPYINELSDSNKENKVVGDENVISKVLKVNFAKDSPRNNKRKEFIKSWFVPKGTDLKKAIHNLPLKKPFNASNLKKIIEQVFHRNITDNKVDTLSTSITLDKIKDLGFKYSTTSGITISLSDIKVFKDKNKFIKKGDEEVNKILQNNDLFENDETRHNDILKIWDDIVKDIKVEVEKELNADKYNPLFVIKDSGARGSSETINQLSGIRGLMRKPNGDRIEIPIKSCFREGMTVTEFFIGTHGARKGSADTALKTSDSGYLTRRLVDVSQDVIVKEEDCGTDHGFTMREFRGADGKVIVSLYDRIRGRFALHDIINPKTKEVIVKANELITNTLAHYITDDEKEGGLGIKEVEIRSIFGCECKDGVCVKCYGRNLATNGVVKIGDAVGIMAAQSVGEPGTQLTMRTFHSGGIGESDITQGLPRVKELIEARIPRDAATLARISGSVVKIDKANRRVVIKGDDGKEEEHYIPKSIKALKFLVKENDKIEKGSRLNDGLISPRELLKITDVNTVESYLLNEIHVPYMNEGIKINDKHLEIIIKQMFRQVEVIDPGDTDFLPGVQVNVRAFEDTNEKMLLEGKRPAFGRRVILGITKASIKSPSFLSAASFQETPKVLTSAAVHAAIDPLHGLKENVITGKLIPAGRGILSEEEEKELISKFSVRDSFDYIKGRYNGTIKKDKDTNK